jgi:hypothetical protein
MKNPDNVILVPCTKKSFFYKWLEFLKPFHSLTNREMEIAASFLAKREELSKVISDNSIIDSVLMSEDTKKKIREECNITLPHFQVVMGELRKSKFIDNNSINPKFIPNLSDDNSVMLLVYYKFND